jgi:hypothetical protein
VSSQDQVFLTVIRYAFWLMMMFGASLGAAIAFGVSESIARSLITTWGVMFTNVITLGAGYLVGKNATGKPKQD